MDKENVLKRRIRLKADWAKKMTKLTQLTATTP
jgi:hypothetical protein